MKQLILVLFAFALFAFNTSAQGYKIGDNAADFSLKNIDGKMVSLKDFKKAKGFIVIFSCNHCPYVIAYEDRMIELDKKYKQLGYPVIAINPNDAVSHPADSYENMVKRSSEKGFTFPYLVDESQAVAKAFGATRTPHVYLLQKNKSDLVVKFIGAIDDNHQDASAVKEPFLANAIDQLLAGKAVTNAETKAIGCTIKWKK